MVIGAFEARKLVYEAVQELAIPQQTSAQTVWRWQQ
jgi:hypothetical protein